MSYLFAKHSTLAGPQRRYKIYLTRFIYSGKILNGITITIEAAQCYFKATPVVLLQGQLIDLHAKLLSAPYALKIRTALF